MRILFIAMSNSIHTARWIAQVADQGWDLHLFPSEDLGYVHPDLMNTTVHHSLYAYQKRLHNSLVRLKGVPVLSEFMANASKFLIKSVFPDYRRMQLKRLVQRLRPDIIHSMEFQSAGYLTHAVKGIMNRQFPLWIATNWGSDIFLYGRLPEHKERIKGVLGACDYYSCECHRDVELAKSMGLRGKVLPVLPNTGGYDLARIHGLIRPEPTSKRRIILLKGYQGLFGRALVGLRAIGMSAGWLQGYRVVIYSASKDEAVKIAAELLRQDSGLPVEIIPSCTHDDMLRLYGQARIYLGLSISDAISTSLLESIVMGTFPIQSNTSSADEWVANGKTGFIVPPEDPEQIAQAIRRAVTEDELVDNAAKINAQTARERLDVSIIKPQVIAMYNQIYAQSQRRSPA
jgi:glycosyltransferase involved in cell wall biosynthesis